MRLFRRNDQIDDDDWSSAEESRRDDEDDRRIFRERVEDITKHTIYAALDGVLLTFGIVSAGFGGDIGSRYETATLYHSGFLRTFLTALVRTPRENRAIVLLGISSIVAMSTNNGLSDMFSAASYQEFVLAEYTRQKRRVASSRGRLEDVNLMTNALMTKKGLSRRHARAIVQKFAQYDSLFVQGLMREKFGLSLPEPGANSPWADGLVTFVSFLVAGLIPVMPSLLLSHTEQNHIFVVTCVFTLSLLFILGVASSLFNRKSSLRCGLECLSMGATMLAVAFLSARSISSFAKASGV